MFADGLLLHFIQVLDGCVTVMMLLQATQNVLVSGCVASTLGIIALCRPTVVALHSTCENCPDTWEILAKIQAWSFMVGS